MCREKPVRTPLVDPTVSDTRIDFLRHKVKAELGVIDDALFHRTDAVRAAASSVRVSEGERLGHALLDGTRDVRAMSDPVYDSYVSAGDRSARPVMAAHLPVVSIVHILMQLDRFISKIKLVDARVSPAPEYP